VGKAKKLLVKGRTTHKHDHDTQNAEWIRNKKLGNDEKSGLKTQPDTRGITKTLQKTAKKKKRWGTGANKTEMAKREKEWC